MKIALLNLITQILLHKHSDTAEIVYEAIENKITAIKIDGTR